WTGKICTYLRSKGAQIRSLTGNVMDAEGWPDRLIVIKGLSVMVEFKGPRTQIRPIQRVTLRRIHQLCPGSVLIARQIASDKLGGYVLHPETLEAIVPFAGAENFAAAINFAVRI